MTYEEHKTAVDTANPTPTPVWVQMEEDPGHHYDDAMIARWQAEYLGEELGYEIHVSPQGTTWYVQEVDDLEAGRRNVVTVNGWAKLQVAFTNHLEVRCNQLRQWEATVAYTREVLTQAGITYTPPVVRRTNARLREMTTVGIDWPYTPAFDGDALAYTGSTALAEHRVKITTEDPDATVAATLNGTAVELNRIGVAQLALVAGENTVVITCTAEDGTTTGETRIVITKS